MTLNLVQGDITLSRADAIVFAHNARGRTELGPVETRLRQRNPAAFSAYARRCRADRQPLGSFWVWTATRPLLVFLTVRPSSVSSVRVRLVQSALQRLANEIHFYPIRRLSVAPLAPGAEMPLVLPVVQETLAPLARLMLITIYTADIPGADAESTDQFSG